MSHKYSVGQDVYYQPSIKHSAARDIYKIVARLPVEADDLLDAEREEHAHHLDGLGSAPALRSACDSRSSNL